MGKEIITNDKDINDLFLKVVDLITQAREHLSEPVFALSWSHYLILMRMKNPDARSFYEIEWTQHLCFCLSTLSPQQGFIAS